MQRKIEKKSVVSEKIVSELFPLNCLYKEDNTFHRQSMCLTNSLKVFDSTNIHFFRLDYVHRDQKIW